MVVVVSIPAFQRLTGRVPDFREFLLSLPDVDSLDIRRAEDAARRLSCELPPGHEHHSADVANTGVPILNPFEPER